jgi:hypothetical protein
LFAEQNSGIHMEGDVSTYSSELIARKLQATFEGVSAEQAVKDVKSTLQNLVALGFVNALETDVPVSSTDD